MVSALGVEPNWRDASTGFPPFRSAICPASRRRYGLVSGKPATGTGVDPQLSTKLLLTRSTEEGSPYSWIATSPGIAGVPGFRVMLVFHCCPEPLVFMVTRPLMSM